MTQFFSTGIIPDVMLIKPTIFKDKRGHFFESFNLKLFTEHVVPIEFVQDNESKSNYGVLRGLHYQTPPFEQAKLIRVTFGEILDAIVDIRNNSPTFGKCITMHLNGKEKHQLFIPRGFAHGFIVLSETATLNYKTDNYHAPEHERGILYSDSSLAIDWEVPFDQIITTERDRNFPTMKQIFT